MKETAFLDELKNLTSQSDLIQVGREVNELNARFEDFVIEEERKLQIAQLDAQEKGEEIPENLELAKLKTEFREELRLYREKRKALLDAKNAEESQNLAKKRSLIKKLTDTIQQEEHIGAAFSALKEIQESWKEIGDIPRDKRDEIQSEYSRLIEDFFYNINIYKQLKEHDLKRNLQMKQEVIQKLQALKDLPTIKEVETHLKALQNDWEDIGPVSNEEWEKLKDEYWKAVHACYSKINTFYEEQRTILNENLNKKRALVTVLKEYIDQLPEKQDTKFWDKATAHVLQIQEDWKKIGFGPRKENEELWVAFREQCDRFFELKKNYFASLQEVFDQIAQKKKEIIEKAHALKESTDWKNTANQLVKLQKQWKDLGNSGPRFEQKLWKQFRAACDVFFDNRQKHFQETNQEFENNLRAKLEVIEKIKAFKLPEDKKEAINSLKAFADEFNAIGKVPMKEKDVVYKTFKTELDKHYADLKLEGEEKSKVMFQAKLDTIASSPEASKLYAREKADLRKRIETLQHDILQLENNLGFFANSKGAESLKKEVEKKIERAKDEIVSIRERIKMIPNE
ncbi:MAG TPA: DUF349 domain-containing protein [Taishania sp.]|nr:DUF349 domain-containing protein [Taishania sp.]